MWNTTNNSNKTVINTPVSGLIQKSNEKSWIMRMHHNSDLSRSLLTENPKYNEDYVQVLQVLLINDGYILVELVNERDL